MRQVSKPSAVQRGIIEEFSAWSKNAGFASQFESKEVGGCGWEERGRKGGREGWAVSFSTSASCHILLHVVMLYVTKTSVCGWKL